MMENLALRTRRLTRAESGRTSGFTLIELLVVLAILGMIVAFVTPQVLKYLGRAKTDAAHIQIENLAGALDLFRLDVGRYPTQQEGLAALVEHPAGLNSWNGPYLKQKSIPADPWGRPYIFKIPGDHGDYDLYSLGADGVPGGTGENQDVTNW
ncbi:MAG: type II secretion system major pseudopilin GspG [Stellaceae bacterium]